MQIVKVWLITLGLMLEMELVGQILMIKLYKLKMLKQINVNILPIGVEKELVRHSTKVQLISEMKLNGL